MKTRHTIGVGFFTAYLFWATVSAQAQGNLLQNGSFETGGLDNWNVQLFGPGAVSDAVIVMPPVPPSSLFPTNCPDGTYFLEFSFKGGSISQTISTTPGVFYDLNFWAIQYDGTNHSSVSVNGSLLTYLNFSSYTFISPIGNSSPLFQYNNNWENFDFNFLATSASTTISFAENIGWYYGGPYNDLYFSNGGLDAISVTVAPEPSAVAVLGVGLAGWLARRRQRVAGAGNP